MSTTKILSTSALAHSASSLQIKHEKSLGINHMKHWSELDAALETQNHQKNSDIFALHHSELNDLPCSKPFEAISFLDSDDDFENEDVGGIDDDFDNREPPQRLHGTPLLAPRSQLSPTRTFIDLSANGPKTIHLPKASQKIANVQLDRVTVVGDELGIFATGKCTKTAKDPVIRKGVSHAPKQPAVVHRGLPSSSPCPDLCPMSLKLLCSNEMPKSAARVSPSGSPLKHPFRIANMKKGPVGNIEAAVQVFKVDVNLPNIPQMCDSKSFRINRMQGNGGKHHATTTPAATVSELQCEKHDLPPLGEARPQDYWGQETLLDGASQCVTQPPRDYGLIIHLALNRPK
jgi:hypothetical protein